MADNPMPEKTLLPDEPLPHGALPDPAVHMGVPRRSPPTCW